MNPITHIAATEQLVTTMSERMAALTRTLSTWMHEQPHSLAELEQHVIRLLKELGSGLLAGLCTLSAPEQPTTTIACACGQQAVYQRERKAQVTTLLGPISIWRSYYLCAACGVGQHPLDAQLQFCAGSRSAALDELLALLGATQDSFGEAAQVLERLTLVHVSANSVRDATEQLGAVLLAHQAEPVAERLADVVPRAPATARPTRLYITMDGVLAHLHERGWSEIKVGCCYQTRSRPDRTRPERLEIRAHSASYLIALEEAQTFGWQLWAEALRRGVLSSDEVVVLGDGAHWIWNIATTHFPYATQILDWYHASEYVWHAASAIWGAAGAQRVPWAHDQLDALWAGQVDAVLTELTQWQERGEAVAAALSYYTTHQGRMDYPSYRARGLQIGSGSVESACKQLVSARLKQAGMIWDAPGAEAVAAVRAWLKSARWEEAVARRGVRTRSYRRRHAAPARVACAEKVHAGDADTRAAARRPALSADVLAQVRAELAAQQGQHVWRRAGSGQHQAEHAVQQQEGRLAIVP